LRNGCVIPRKVREAVGGLWLLAQNPARGSPRRRTVCRCSGEFIRIFPGSCRTAAPLSHLPPTHEAGAPVRAPASASRSIRPAPGAPAGVISGSSRTG
jgi:hypothetical protein